VKRLLYILVIILLPEQ